MALSASIQTKKGRLYAVIQAKIDGKTKSVWRAMGVEEGCSKRLMNKAFREAVEKYEEEWLKETANLEREGADLPVYDYVKSDLERKKKNLQKVTIEGYSKAIEGRIKQYFAPKPNLTVGSLRPKDVRKFYNSMYAAGVTPNTVLSYHTLLHAAFQQAYRDEIIDVNPFDRVERPKKIPFNGDHYSKEELLLLLSKTEDDPIHAPIVLASAMGLRRSEALGIRWSRIDWEKKSVLLDTKIATYTDESGKTVTEPIEQMKNRSSRRTLPIPEQVMEMLKQQLEKRELYQKLFKQNYCKEYLDYVCVNEMGFLLRPNYVTRRFRETLEKNNLRHIRFHDLRHTFASLMLSEEVPLINVSRYLGHSDVSTTANIYAHLDKASKQSTANVMEHILSGSSESEYNNNEGTLNRVP